MYYIFRWKNTSKTLNENIYKYIYESLYSITQGAQRILVSSWPDSVSSKTSLVVISYLLHHVFLAYDSDDKLLWKRDVVSSEQCK